MKNKKPPKPSVIFLIIYFIIVICILISNEIELHDLATCCGLYGCYKRYFLPFPIVNSSTLSHWGRGPTQLLYSNIFKDIIIPIVIFLISQLITKVSFKLKHQHE